MSIDLKAAVRTAILANAEIRDELATYGSSKAVFTRRPIPDDAPYPCIVISDMVIDDGDGLVSRRPTIDVDVCVYGKNDPQGAEYRTTETIGYALRNLFHRQRWSITQAGAHVSDVTCRGPLPAPTDDEKTVGRVVTLQVRLVEEA